jgi:LDH2 family malate/lactate/ureidoglycolate dehydrogenase
MKINIKNLQKLVTTALLKGYDDKSAKLISDVIMFGELSGKKSHGIVRLIVGSSSVLAQNPSGKPKIIKRTKLSRLINGNGNPAMLVGQIAMSESISLAKNNGFGIVGTNNTFSTSGCLSYYLERIAKEYLIGIIMARSPSDIAPFKSIEPLFGTNPIGFAIPSKPSPLIFDMGTSAISWGALLKADSAGEKIPDGVAIGPDGKSTTTPSKAMKGALLTFDKSYKSSGLSMMVEILSGVLTGASFLDINKDDQWGNTFLVFKPDLLIDVNEFKNRMKKFVARMKSAKTRDGGRIRITGEKTLKTRDMIIKHGDVEVADELIRKVEDYIKRE